MKTLIGCALVAGLAVMAGLTGCKGQPDKPKAESKAVTEPGVEVLVNESTTGFVWPRNDAQLAELRAMPTKVRNEVLRGMIPAEYEAHRARGPITIDGVLDEDDWALAQGVRMRDVGHGTPAWYGTTVKLAYDDDNLYVAFECDDPNVASTLANHDEALWKEDSVEVTIDAKGDEKGYVELMVSPKNVTYDAVWADFRAGADWMMQPTWERFDMDSTVKAYDAEGVKSAVKVKGTLNAPDDTDEGYTVEFAIPWSALREARPFQPTAGKIDMRQAKLDSVKAPKAGAVWRMNFLRSNPSAPLIPDGEMSAWSPTGGSVQQPVTFGKVRFGE